jgi:glycopeptide antibiotics resistance protein
MSSVSPPLLRLEKRVRINRAERRRLQWWCALLAAATAFLIAYVSFVPFNFQRPPVDTLLTDHLFANTLRSPEITTANFLANIVLFLPLGFFGAGSFVDERSRFMSWVTALFVVIAFALGWSLAVETTQVLLPGRISSLADVVAQIAGTLLGIGAWALLAREIRTFTSTFAQGSRRALESALGVYAVVLLFLMLQPFDITVEVVEIGRKVRDGGVVLNPARSPALEWPNVPSLFSDFVMAIPIGVLAAIAGHGRGRRRSTGLALGFGAAYFVVGELAQVLVRSRTADIVDVAVNCLGMTAGVLLASTVARATESSSGAGVRDRVLELGLLLSMGIYAVTNLSPFDFVLSGDFVQDRIGRLWAVPFAGYQWNQEFKALSDFMTKLAMALPLGALFQMRFRPHASDYRRTLTWGWLLLTGSFLAVVEFGQVLLPSRYPESTDVLIGILAVWLGIRLSKPFGT